MYIQYQLPFAYEALEPHIDALTMENHYSKHHAAYTKNLNDAAAKAGVSGKLLLSASPNQDNPLIEGYGFVPILGIDV